ncbi:hypothetical protein Pint_20531 [Pistacia integerrima]|uniref:Uncharacterized protein n=1 Tax=Pistacia integerrima TaxID=434235 RepID=A0ACC0XCS2_9ROSI|nr:hypothetical protein Pint_20531 [Pistacia integerrima]
MNNRCIGEYHCPVLNKVVTEFTNIVAVRTTGNVFCYDLPADEPFIKEDLITIQNPNALDFDLVKKGLKLDDEDPTYNINIAGDIKQMLQELGTEKGKQTALLINYQLPLEIISGGEGSC